MDDPKICKDCDYGRHIRLRCKNHPDLHWSTKNIECIGARTIFYNLDGSLSVSECDCPASDLYHDHVRDCCAPV